MVYLCKSVYLRNLFVVILLGVAVVAQAKLPRVPSKPGVYVIEGDGWVELGGEAAWLDVSPDVELIVVAEQPSQLWGLWVFVGRSFQFEDGRLVGTKDLEVPSITEIIGGRVEVRPERSLERGVWTLVRRRGREGGTVAPATLTVGLRELLDERLATAHGKRRWGDAQAYEELGGQVEMRFRGAWDGRAEAREHVRQQVTMARLCAVAEALAAYAAQTVTPLETAGTVPIDALYHQLVPHITPYLPRFDAWGNEIVVRARRGQPPLVVSPGRNRRLESDELERDQGVDVAVDANKDLILRGLDHVSWPAPFATLTSRAADGEIERLRSYLFAWRESVQAREAGLDPDHTRQRQAVAELMAIGRVLASYRAQEAGFPVRARGPLAGIADLLAPYGGADLATQDPWNSIYVYHSDGRQYWVTSLGADRRESGPRPGPIADPAHDIIYSHDGFVTWPNDLQP